MKYPFEKDSNRNKAIDILGELTTLFNKSQINYFVAAGTLLGIVRDKTLISWDTDIDLYVEEKSVKALEDILLEQFLSRYDDKLVIQKRYNENDILLCFELDFVIKDLEFEISISILRLEGGEAKTLFSTFPIEHFQSATKIVFNNYNLRVPYNVEGYLGHCYGEWKIPNQNSTFEDIDNINAINSDSYNKHYYIEMKI